MPVSPQGIFIYSPRLRQQSVVRKQISLYSAETVGLKVLSSPPTAVPIWADANSMQMTLFQQTGFDNTQIPPGTQIDVASETNGKIVRSQYPGVYEYTINPQFTNVPCLFTSQWTYTQNSGVLTFAFTDYYEVLEYMPTYLELSPGPRYVIEMVTNLMGDMFDSTEGGPSLSDYFQSKYGYERLSQILNLTVRKINTEKQVLTNYTVNNFPEEWYGLLIQGLYVDTVRHFIRSYVEQPDLAGVQVSYANRRDYLNRWQSVLEEEKESYYGILRLFKRKHMNLGRPSMIIAGGVFGGSAGGLFRAGQYAAATRSWRFYPAMFSVAGVGRSAS